MYLSLRNKILTIMMGIIYGIIYLLKKLHKKVIVKLTKVVPTIPN